MPKKDGFEVTWEAEDGYVCGSRPHHFQISPDDLDEDMSDEDLKSLFWEAIQSDFERRVSPVSEDEERFLEWARTKIEDQKNENV
jgi:hypothetical protein